MTVTFVLPRYFDHPIGGYRAHLEHANRLAARGHAVTVCMPLHQGKISGARSLWRGTVMYWRLWSQRKKPNYGVKWFSFKGSRLQLIPDYRSFWLRGSGDAIVATGWQTAAFVSSLPMRLGHKFYSILGYEEYMSADEKVRPRIAETYNLGLTHMASTETINRLVISLGGTPATVVDQGVDFDRFSLANPVDSPERDTIGFCVRRETFKRTGDAVEALKQVRETFPRLKIWSFGENPPPGFPDWIEHHHRPSDQELADLYNRTMIFVCSSLYEGWGLPGSEAMTCGAALVSTDNGGVTAYAKDGDTALIVPPCDPPALASAIIKLMENPGLRLAMADRGASSIKRLDWESSTTKLENVLLRNCN